MLGDLGILVGLSVLIGLSFSLLIERLLQPGTLPPWKRSISSLLIHVGIWLLLFVLELAQLQRPWFAVLIVSAFLLFIVLVSNAKLHALREPFVFQDFEYFVDTFRHPRLYLPFLGLTRALLALAGFIVAFYAGLRFETPLTDSATIGEFTLVLAVLALFGVVLVYAGSKRRVVLALEPVEDQWQLGLIAGLWQYALEERLTATVIHSGFSKVDPIHPVAGEFSNLVVVQSESFLDIRRMFRGIRPELLKEFDAIKAESICHGRLDVPAWGANTVRTEFAFLSGVAAHATGVHRFNPYRKLARQKIPTLAGYLRNIGYRTVCVHPYPASFYARDKVIPFLGFDEFIDITQFEGAEKVGSYIGDVALAEKICGMLSDVSEKPVFIFVITMENHGPLHLERVVPEDTERVYSISPPPGCDELTIYLNHLRNADRMARILCDQLSTLTEPSCLCWFGDHVPIMPKAYRVLGEPQGQTDYFVWSNKSCGGVEQVRDRKIEDLGIYLLEQMGLIRATKPV